MTGKTSVLSYTNFSKLIIGMHIKNYLSKLILIVRHYNNSQMIKTLTIKTLNFYAES